MASIDPASRALLEDRNFAFVATQREDGTIQNVPVWVHVEGDLVTLNSAEGRAWPKNLRRTGQITVTVPKSENPYEFTTITGHLEREETETADADIDFLAKKYMDVDSYPFRQEGEQRVKFYIAPDRVFHMAQ
jgi:PPOX class probable F420-dependent enzyme